MKQLKNSFDYGLDYANNYINKKLRPMIITTNGVPFKPHNNLYGFVSGFGSTLSIMNGIKKNHNNFDWYYKGTANSLITQNGILSLHQNGKWGGFETELVMIHIINNNLRPIYLGYTIGLDFTDTGLRRDDLSMINLSHLYRTAISNYVALKPFPTFRLVKTEIIRNNNAVWNKKGVIGTNNMWVSPEKMSKLLFNNVELLEPRMVFYTLTGASLSSAKDGIKLRIMIVLKLVWMVLI